MDTIDHQIALLEQAVEYWQRKAQTLIAEKEYLEMLDLPIPERITTSLIHANDLAIEKTALLEAKKTEKLNG